MSATSIFYNGRIIRNPGVYSKVDARGLERQGISSAGVVAVLGESSMWRAKPANEIAKKSDFLKLTGPAKIYTEIREGDLLDGVRVLFDPANDENIPGGAGTVIPVNVRPDTQSSAVLARGAEPSIDLLSVGYGAWTEQENILVGTGTSQGKSLLISFEDQDPETHDNVGGGNRFGLRYLDGTYTYESMVLTVGADGRMTATGTRADAGLDADVNSQLAGDDSGVNVVFAGLAAGDVGKTLTLYGLNAAGAALQRERITITSTGYTYTSPLTWNRVYGAILSEPLTTGTADVKKTGATNILVQLTGSDRAVGAVVAEASYVALDSDIVLAADGATTVNVHIWGRAGTTVMGKSVTLAGTTPVYERTRTWTEIEAIILALVPAARAITTSVIAARTDPLVQDTLRKAKDFFDARLTSDEAGEDIGFQWTQQSGSLDAAVTELDDVFRQDILDSTAGASAGFKADQQAVIDAINRGQLMTAERHEFTPKVDDLTITAASQSYTYSIDSIPVVTASLSSPTESQVQDALVAAGFARPFVADRAKPSVQSTNKVRNTSQGSDSFTTSAVGTNVTNANTTAQVGTRRVPDDTAVPVFLAGGIDGTTSFSDWVNALEKLARMRVNSVGILTGDPALHDALKGHIRYTNGIGRSERDGAVGLSALDGSGNPTGELPTKDEILEQLVDLNSKDIRAVAQTITRFDENGDEVILAPWFSALAVLGMQAGSPIGEPMTWKYMNAREIGNDASWDPVLDIEEMIEGGLLVLEDVDGIGIRVVRNITTHLTTSNLAFVEASTNQAVNVAVYEHRKALEIGVGRKGFAGTLAALKGVAIGNLEVLLKETIIVDHGPPAFDLFADVAEESVEMAPVTPLNFIVPTFHLRLVRLAA